ncbi:hypothetical protein MPC1_5210003 [Methylocella tundrae]|uniref:flagellar hook-length control protein FliK n=1 Tax=Methylocella tundrae TaxID=227605 RepID=UPI001312960E|nr:flagellar hook-length control protein FliK [Methylocella tundrae]VTZ27321.1 hypothetical protein MPC1_5210003 [Methylocella tundrae]
MVSSSLAGASSDVWSGQIANIPINNGASAAAPWSGIAPYQRSIDAMPVAPSIQPSLGRGDADVPRVPKPAAAGAITLRSSMDLAAAQRSAAAVAMKSPSSPLRAPASSGRAVATFEETEAAPFQATALGERAAAMPTSNLPSAPQPQGRQATPGLSAPPGNAPSGMPATDLTPTPEESSASFSKIAAASPRAGQSTGFPERGQIKVAVLDRQSHFPPTAGFSPIHQIADRIAPEAASLVSSLGEAAEPGASSGASPAAGVSDATQSKVLPTVMKSLNLQLEPETLGAVTIRMRLSGSRLEVQVEPARADTMRLISDDKDRLAEKLRSSAYTLDGVVVKLAGQQSPHLQQGADPTTSSDTQRNVPTSWRPSQQGGWSADDQSGAQRESASSQQRARDESEDRSSGVNSGGAVYL